MLKSSFGHVAKEELLDKEIKTKLFSFTIDGEINNQRFVIAGNAIYDNSKESREAYEQEVRERIEAWERQQLYGPILSLVIPLLIGTLFIILVVGLIRRRKKKK